MDNAFLVFLSKERIVFRLHTARAQWDMGTGRGERGGSSGVLEMLTACACVVGGRARTAE